MAPETEAPATRDVAPRRRRRLLRRVMGAIEQRQRIQDLAYGLLVSALAMAWPSSLPYTSGGEAARRLDGANEVITQGLLYPLGSGLVGTVEGMDGDSAIRLIAALCLGGAFTLTLAFLRGLGFRRTASLPASVAAFAAPFSWVGATSPIDYAPGMFGSSLLLWSLFRQPQDTPRGYQWRAIVCFGVAFMLHMELVFLVPATAWAVARHPEYRREAQITAFSVIAVLIGGVEFNGGRGSYLGAVAGAIFLTTLTSILVTLNIEEGTRKVITGLVLLVLLVAYTRKAGRG